MTTDIKPQNKGSKQLFNNPILEKLSRTHISVPLIIFFSYAGGLLYWNTINTSLSLASTVILFVSGMIAWSLTEYTIHRYLFHMKAYTEAKAKLQYTLHGIHHEFPKDKDRLAMPPLVSITIGTILLLIFKVIMGDLVFAFLPGYMVGYAFYLSIHYMVHAYPPPRNFFKPLWVNHSIHHYKDGEVVFGVSSPLWDYVFRTMKSKEVEAGNNQYNYARSHK